MKSNIVLIGFMGTGKSSIGRQLAKVLQKDFIDTDQEIERLTGLTIPRIFAKHGEVRFRSEEKLMVKKVAKRENCVISTGGGVVLAPENVAELKKNGILICLSASPETILARIGRGSNRPLLRKKKSIEEIRRLLEDREPYYRCADFYIDTTGLQTSEIIEKIVQLLRERGRDHAESKS
ncbi:shikimate kinase [Zhaonella formicivorans]|jgi:shikimate kinase|uniref:shikimate kinase n=1 Tax=Zhaonella formicivorans TaxID=2528593 RepID=UPI0010DEEF36|nr:shikimate kinase [Zhaonella formicivorans]